MLANDALLLAVITGALFGVIVSMVGTTWQRLAVILTILYVLQTGAQQLLRIVEGIGSSEEFITITIYRMAFAIAACLVVYIVERRREG